MNIYIIFINNLYLKIYQLLNALHFGTRKTFSVSGKNFWLEPIFKNEENIIFFSYQD